MAVQFMRKTCDAHTKFCSLESLRVVIQLYISEMQARLLQKTLLCYRFKKFSINEKHATDIFSALNSTCNRPGGRV